jgi:hypothetical protein
MKQNYRVIAVASAILLCAVPAAFAEETNFDKLARQGDEGDGSDTPRRTALPTGDADVSLGDTVGQYARHAGWLREDVRCWLQCSADLEGTTRRQNSGDDPQL